VQGERVRGGDAALRQEPGSQESGADDILGRANIQLAAYGCTQSDALASFLTDPSNPARKATSAQSKSKSQDKDRSHGLDEANTTTAQAQPSGSQSQAQASYPHPQPERVFSSAFYRCIQTALPTAKSLGVGVSLEHGVGEW
jgi:hypothetical protein